MNKKLKILFLTRSFYPNIGGVEKHVLEISSVLADLGHEITVMSEESTKAYSNNYQSESYSAKNAGKAKKIRMINIHVGYDNLFKKFRIWIQLFKYINLIRSADVVHSHDVYFWYFPFRFIFPFKKNYVTFHGYEGNNLPTKKAILMHKISERLSSGNICVGDFLKKWYGTKPDFVTYGAVDKNIFKKSHEVKKIKELFLLVGWKMKQG